MSDATAARAILEVARWAPSGDNTQPWRFEIISADHIVVHGFDTREHCVYDLDGHSSQLALGGLLESIRIAATGHGLATEVQRRTGLPETRPTFDVRLRSDSAIKPDVLVDCLPRRCVQRRPLSTRPLSNDDKTRLETSVGPSYGVQWLEGAAGRWRAARLMWRNGHLRLTLPEAFEVHRKIIEWGARFSEDRIPEQALGANPLTTRTMRFALQSWPRVQFMNRWLGGTIGPRLELDVLPSLACAAHFLIFSGAACRNIDDYVVGGAAMQRFWLTATSLGLQLQPEMTPLIFARYASHERSFSRMGGALRAADAVAGELTNLFGAQAVAGAIFMGRLGEGPVAAARSLRLPLEKLMIQGA